MKEQNLTADDADVMCAALKKLEELPLKLIRFIDSAGKLYFTSMGQNNGAARNGAYEFPLAYG